MSLSLVKLREMERKKPDEGVTLGEIGMSEEEKKQARMAVITNVAAFAAIVVALRVGKGSSTKLTLSLSLSLSLTHTQLALSLYFSLNHHWHMYTLHTTHQKKESVFSADLIF